jgi:L-lactate dehydrogenase complex protein LldE
MIVDVFYPCPHDGFSEQNLGNLLKIIKKLGDTPVISDNFLCCGQSAYIQGFHELSKSYAIQILTAFQMNRPVISASTSCLGFMQKRYNPMFYNTSYHNEHKQLMNNLMDITQYLADYKKKLDIEAVFPHKVFYYASCSSLRKHEVKDAPIKLLENVKDLKLVHNPKPVTACCGNGGGFSFNYPTESDKLTNVLLDDILNHEVDYITSTDASCLLKMQNMINIRKLNLKTIHIVDILAAF